ncbi:hypothetical protein HXX76_005267 [Chlamydomonas incerta]|uniref:RAP domain-containing protein n=1 Tax=Chlamydomonas incerta TaxID=51695 RepID=A0A835T7Z5_CHLIN|nr:hypothetical protein HXX76_005267 [Chlamydomonas incerta]|eukprot:KAG2438722.1 hypothetical protein HXX76_005267 [Chlamydomonas incerta]
MRQAAQQEDAREAGPVAAPPAAHAELSQEVAPPPVSGAFTHSSNRDTRSAVRRDAATADSKPLPGPTSTAVAAVHFSSSSNSSSSNSSSSSSSRSSSSGAAIASGGGGGGGGGSAGSGNERMMAARRAVVMMQWDQHLGRRGRSSAPLLAGGKGSSTSSASSSIASTSIASISNSNSTGSGSVRSETSGAATSSPEGHQPAARQAALPAAAVGHSQTGSSAPAPATATPTAPLLAPPLPTASTVGTAVPAAVGAAVTTPPVMSGAAGAGTAQPTGPLLAGVRPALLGRTIQGRIARLQAAQEELRAVRQARVEAALQPPMAQPPLPAQAQPPQGQPAQGQSGQVPQVARLSAQAQPGQRQDSASTATQVAATGLPARSARPAVLAPGLQADTTTAAPSLPASGASLNSPGLLAAAAPVKSVTSRPAMGTSAATAGPSSPAAASAASTETAGIVRAPADLSAATPAAAPVPAAAPAPAPAAAPAAAAEAPEAAAARDLLTRLSRYQPISREDGPAVLAPYARYSPAAYQAAATAAAAQPQLLLAPLSLPQLAAVAAGYAAAGHRHEQLLEALAGVALTKAGGASSIGGGGGSGRAAGAVSKGKAASEAKQSRLTFRAACVFLTALARLGYRGAAVTRLAAALGVWLARQLNSGAVTPRAKWKGTWLAAALWAYAALEQLPVPPAAAAAAPATAPPAQAAAPSSGGDAAAAAARGPSLPAPPLAPPRTAASPELELARGGALLFTEAAEAVRVAPGWLHLMDGREALWSLWAFRRAAVAYGRGEGTASGAVYVAAAGGYAMLQSGGGGGGGRGPGGMAALPLVVAAPRYEANPLVELKLAARATSLFPQLDPGQLAEAHVLLLECGLAAGEFPQALAALRRCAIARAESIRPQPLAVMVAALAAMQVRDVVWLSALAMACRNKMINMMPDQIVAVLHAFGSVLRFHHLPLFHAAAVVCSTPDMWRLGGLGAGEVLRLAGAFAATRHYEGRLLRAAAERMLQLGSTGSTAGQRAGLLQSLCSLQYRHNGLLRVVAMDTFGLAGAGAASGSGSAALVNWGSSTGFAGAGAAAALATPLSGAAGAARQGLTPNLLVAVAEACGQLQHRPPGLLPALHASRAVVWPRLAITQRATLCWALLVLTGGLSAQTSAAAVPRAAKRAGRQLAAAAASQEQHQLRHRQRQLEQEQLLLQALVDYLQALGVGSQRWPPSAPCSHHVQLLVACTVLASCPPLPATALAQPGQEPSATGAQDVQQTPDELSSQPTALQQQLRGELNKLPAGAVQRALEVERRARSSALAGWAREVAAVVREVLQEAHVDDAADAEAQQPLPPQWLGRPPAVLVSSGVSTGVEVCDSAMLVDVAVELELEVPQPLAKGRGRGRRTSARATADVPSTEQGADVEEAAAELPRRLRQRLRLALDLCPLPPPPPRTAAPVRSAAAGAGVGARSAAEAAPARTTGAPWSLAVGAALGGAVVRNSRWLLSGTGALRRRLLTRGGWLVVPVRERQWKDLRSAEQRRRAVREWLRAALAHVQL